MDIKIPTVMTRLEAKILRCLARDSHVMEIGSLLGYATVNMALTAKSVVSIDPHDGYPTYAPRATLNEFNRNLLKYKVINKVKPIIGYAQDALPKLKNNHFDLLFVDCTGEYGITKFCLEHSNARIKTVHDFYRGGCSGATEAVIEYANKNGKRIEKHDTLAVIV